MDWIGFTLTVAGLLINARKGILCWPVWLLGNVAWLTYSIPNQEWAIVVSNLTFIVINIFGWIAWSRK